MKIGLQTWGSNGDVRPMLALADGMQKAGHSLTLAVSSIDNSDYSTVCRDLNIRYIRTPELITFDMPAFARRSYRMNTLQWLNALLEEAFFPYEQIIYQTSRRLSQENDCLLGHHFLYPLKLAAARQDKPYISITLCHAAIDTVSRAPFRFANLGPIINRMEWRLLHLLFDFALKKRLSELWIRENMPPVKHVYPDLLTSEQLNLVAVDPLFCPHSDEWAPLHRICGFLNLPDAAQVWQPPEQLRDFLAQGEAPVYMTFGSLQQAVPEWSMELFISAAETAGCRAIIQTSSRDYPAGSRQGDIYFIGSHPHQPLFKHCAAVVHHGGAGTTQSAVRSGCPSIVVPFMDEQLFWGRQLQGLGLAGKPLLARNATRGRLAKRIAIVLQSGTMRDNTRRAALQMLQHDGVASAVELIQRFCGKALISV